MGKSLSILAISIQVYNINGWSIYPSHLAVNEDDELPASMDHIRPYLRKRSGKIQAPPGLQHNLKSRQSRQLLMQQTPIRTTSPLRSPIHSPRISTVQSTFVPSILGSLNRKSALELANLLGSDQEDTSIHHISDLYHQATRSPDDYQIIEKLSRLYSKHISKGPPNKAKFNIYTAESSGVIDHNNEKVKLMVLGSKAIDDAVNNVKAQFEHQTAKIADFSGFGLYFFEIFKEMFVRNIQMKPVPVLLQDEWQKFSSNPIMKTFEKELLQQISDEYVTTPNLAKWGLQGLDQKLQIGVRITYTFKPLERESIDAIMRRVRNAYGENEINRSFFPEFERLFRETIYRHKLIQILQDIYKQNGHNEIMQSIFTKLVDHANNANTTQWESTFLSNLIRQVMND